MDFHSMKRKSLQALCKKHNIPANTTNVEMADKLASLLKKPGQFKGLDRRGFKEIDTRRAKKVRFCLEEEQNGFIDLTKSEDGNLMGKSKQKHKNLGITENPKASKDSPVKLTRSKRGIGAAMVDSSPVEKKKLKRGLQIGYSNGDEKEASRSDVDAEVIVILSSPENTIERSRRGKVKAGEMEKASLNDGSRVDAEVVVLSSSGVEKMRTRSRGGKAKAGVEKPSSNDGTTVHAEVTVRTSLTENKKKKREGKAGADDGVENTKNKPEAIALEYPVATQVVKGPPENTIKPEERAPRRSKRKSSIMYNSVIPEGTELLLKGKVDAPENLRPMVNEKSEEGPKPVKPRRRSLRIALKANTSEGLQQDAEVVQQLTKDLVDLKKGAISETYDSPNVASSERICKTVVLLEMTSDYKVGENVIEADSIGTSPHSQDIVEDGQVDKKSQQELVNHKKEAVSELSTISVSYDVNLIEKFVGELEELVSDSLGIISVRSSPLSEASNPFNVRNKERVATISNTDHVNVVAEREAECLQPVQEDMVQDAEVLRQLTKDPVNDTVSLTPNSLNDGSDVTVLKTEVLVDVFYSKIRKNMGGDGIQTSPHSKDAKGQQQAPEKLVNLKKCPVSGSCSNYNDKDNVFVKLIEEFQELVSDSLQIIARTSTLSDAFSPSEVKNKENMTRIEQNCGFLNRSDLVEEKHADSTQDVPEIFQSEKGLEGEAVNYDWFNGTTVAENDKTTQVSPDSSSFIIEVVSKQNANCEFQNNDNVTADEEESRFPQSVEEFATTKDGDMVDEFSVLCKNHKACQVHETEVEVKENAVLIIRSDGKNCENAAPVSVLEEKMGSLTCRPECPSEYTGMHAKINIKKDEEEESMSTKNTVEENEEIAFNGEGTTVGTSQQVQQQLAIFQSHIHREEEADGYDISVLDYPIHQSCENKLESSSGNKKSQTDPTDLMGSFPESITQFTSYCSEIQLESAMVFQGNTTAACMQNRPPGKILEEIEVGEAVSAEKVDDTNRDKDSSLPFINSSMDRSYSCSSCEIENVNKYRSEHGLDVVVETAMFSPSQSYDVFFENPTEFQGDKTQLKLSSSLEECSNVEFNVNLADEEETLKSSLSRLFAVEQPAVNVKRKRQGACTIKRTPMRSSGHSQGHLLASGTKENITNSTIENSQGRQLASGMKENIMNSTIEKPSNRNVEKLLIKRRALENLQNSINR